MFANLPILSLITFAPAFVAIMLAIFSRLNPRGGREQLEKNAPLVALAITGVVFIASIILLIGFDSSNPDYQFVENVEWLGGGIQYRMGVDGISVLFVVLTAFLMPFCILASQTSIKKRMLEYICLLYTSPSPRDRG